MGGGAVIWANWWRWRAVGPMVEKGCHQPPLLSRNLGQRRRKSLDQRQRKSCQKAKGKGKGKNNQLALQDGSPDGDEEEEEDEPEGGQWKTILGKAKRARDHCNSNKAGCEAAMEAAEKAKRLTKQSRKDTEDMLQRVNTKVAALK